MKEITSKKKKKRRLSEDKTQLVNEAYNTIKSMLYNKELPPGQRIVYGDIAGRLNMSLTPVIQALHKLENADLVNYKHNKGYFVEQLTEEDVREIYQARKVLEIAILPAIIANMDEEDLQLVKNNLKEYEFSLTSLEAKRINMLKDMQFHLKIAEYSRQTVIVKILRNLYERISLLFRSDYLGDERINNAIEEHKRIVHAILHKDEKEAVAAIIDHNRSSVDFITESIEKSQNISLVNFNY